MPTFTPATLEALTGLSLEDASAGAIFEGLPALEYTPVDEDHERALFADINRAISKREFRVVGQDRDQRVWEKGWQEVAALLNAAGDVSIETLKPQYFHPGVPFRLLGQYVIPQTDYFEYYAGLAVRRQLMLSFLDDCSDLLELGCGTGINLLLASDLFRGASLSGSDWTQATLDILSTLGRARKHPIKPVLFNMLEAHDSADLPIGPGTDVLTVHALEQLGPRADVVVDLLIRHSPRRCLHIEPVLEFYEESSPFDDIARRYHLARNYLQGLMPKLKRLEDAGKIEIIAQRRVKLGNQFHEAYSYIVWRPM